MKIRHMFENISHVSSGRFISRSEWIHPDRCIDSYEVMFVLSGRVYINEEGREYALEKNDLLILEPGRRHFGYKHSTDTSFYWAHFTGGAEIPPEVKRQSIATPYNLSVLFSQLLHYSFEGGSREAADYIIRLILIELYSDEDRSESRRVGAVAAWIKANADIPLRVADVSRHFGYNEDYLSRLFRAQKGRSVKEYIDGARISYIKNQLLTSGEPLRAIAAACGFSEYKYFLKYFKYHTGMTPTQFCRVYSNTKENNK